MDLLLTLARSVTINQMKIKILTFLLVAAICIGTSSCVTTIRVKPSPHKEKKMPPGQVKKITGSKSAKQYAPGHNK